VCWNCFPFICLEALDGIVMRRLGSQGELYGLVPALCIFLYFNEGNRLDFTPLSFLFFQLECLLFPNASVKNTYLLLICI